MNGPGGGLGLFTDLYELTMVAAYLDEGRADTIATFELFVRSLPARRRFLVACGGDQAAEALGSFTFTADDLDYLASLELFPPSFLDTLGGFRFTGEVLAVADGEVLPAGVPLMSVTAPLWHAQLVETFLINAVQLPTMVATKAAHVALACGDRSFVDFSARRDHGLDAAMTVARAAYVGGAAGTSLVSAGRRWGLPVSGTMAHSYVMAHETEEQAFRAFLRRYGTGSVLLIDTYDTVEGARVAARAMRAEGVVARAVRLDSGDLADLAIAVRAVLDEEGFPTVRLFASGDLDEDRIARLLAAGAPIDAFGVGTRLGTSADQPYLEIVYKLVELDGHPRVKRSPGKATIGGRKQAWRDGATVVLGRPDEVPPGVEPLLRPPQPADLAAARARCAAGIAAPPDPQLRLTPTLLSAQVAEADS